MAIIDIPKSIVLHPKDYDHFVEVCKNPPEPNDKLKAIAKRYSLENEMRKRRNEVLCKRIVYRIIQNAVKRGSWCAKT